MSLSPYFLTRKEQDVTKQAFKEAVLGQFFMSATVAVGYFANHFFIFNGLPFIAL